MLLGSAAMDKLRRSHVAVIGLGGVGSYAAEALSRSGLGELTLLDQDVFSETNLNRQLGALLSTVGESKAAVMARRAGDIDAATRVNALEFTYSAETRERLFELEPDYIVDAIDLVSCKLDLIQTAKERGVAIISCLGTGNRTDASSFTISDISLTHTDPLARVIRKELRHRGIEHHTVLWSSEPPLSPLPLEEPPPGRRSVPGSVAWVPSAAGLMLAGHVIMELASGAREG